MSRSFAGGAAKAALAAMEDPEQEPSTAEAGADKTEGTAADESDKTVVKLVVVGDGFVGKTCLLLSYANNEFPKDYVPTVFDNFCVDLSAGEQKIELSLWDTAGQETYDRLRPLAYANASVYLLCFSVTEPVSFENISSKWHPELAHYSPKAPIILVGTKCDLRDAEGGTKEVSFEQGVELAKSLGAVRYMETSAMTRENLKEVFDEAVRAVLQPKNAEGSCVIQ